jgi:hypothetical protein
MIMIALLVVIIGLIVFTRRNNGVEGYKKAKAVAKKAKKAMAAKNAAKKAVMAKFGIKPQTFKKPVIGKLKF